VDTSATANVADVRIPGGNNDLSITRTGGAGSDNFKVIFQQNGSLGMGASAAPITNNTLTVQVNRGQTPASAVKTQIEALGNLNVSYLDDDPTGVTTGAGAVTVSKLILISPDFGKLFDGLELCDVIANSTGPLLEGLDKLLGSIQDGLNSIVS